LELPEIDPERDLLVVYDDLDLPLGRIRLRPSGGDGGHRGMTSVIDALGTRNFARLRFGVGRPEGTDETVTFVLEAFTAAEEAVLELGIPRASLAVITALREGVSVAMNRFNRDPDRDLDAAIL
jgi:PTH1 family peptidyl-tRNA hydrolase